MSLNQLGYSKEKNSLKSYYIVPKRIVTEAETENSEHLLGDTPRQASIGSTVSCVIKDGGYILLDFGCELQGGVELCMNSVSDITNSEGFGKVRIVLGESVTEALSSVGDECNARNDHSTRDMTVHTCGLSTMRYGRSGFRFAKIEAVGCTLKIGGIKAVLEIRDLEYKGSFRCNDERLNKIFDTAAYTVHLCMQDYLWDGIKRDRLVWVGDMHPEVSAISSIFGYDECVEKSLDFVRDSYPAESTWMVSPSYSCWWIRIHWDWYMQNGRFDYLKEQGEYMYSLVGRIISLIDDDGTLHFDDYFVDWSSAETEYMEAGFRSCLITALEAAAKIFDTYGDSTMSQNCLTAVRNVKKLTPPYEGNKQVCALSVLTGLCAASEAERVICKDLTKGLSTFYGYYVLHALEKAGKLQEAIDVMRDYWGAMLDHGATTFWEDFDIEWTENAGRIDEIVPQNKKDIHADYGRFCYQKLRHSLCHGWASGPAPFMAKKILGVEIIEPGCKKLRISPGLGDLEWVRGTYPTPYGIVEIEHRKKDGKIVSEIKAPHGVEIWR
ncbi:MAG: alpha-L-rhamnosidase [Clostridia bacterium]|nr:alpha-L-rhamnosidase [Clostridia bacterium]